MSWEYLLLGGCLVGLAAFRVLRASNGATPTLFTALVVVWGTGLIVFSTVSPFLLFSQGLLATALAPLVVAMLVSGGMWNLAVPELKSVPSDTLDRVVIAILGFCLLAVVAWDALRTLALLREVGPVQVLAVARQARHAGEFYPSVLAALNPIKIAAGPFGWAIYETSDSPRLRAGWGG